MTKPNPLTARIIRLEARRPRRRQDDVAAAGRRLIAWCNALDGAPLEVLRAAADHVHRRARQAPR